MICNVFSPFLAFASVFLAKVVHGKTEFSFNEHGASLTIIIKMAITLNPVVCCLNSCL